MVPNNYNFFFFLERSKRVLCHFIKIEKSVQLDRTGPSSTELTPHTPQELDYMCVTETLQKQPKKMPQPKQQRAVTRITISYYGSLLRLLSRNCF